MCLLRFIGWFSEGLDTADLQRARLLFERPVIADCIEESKASSDPELISDYIAEALGVLQTDSTEDDAFNMLGSAIIDAVTDDPTHTEVLLEVWSELEEQRQLQ